MPAVMPHANAHGSRVPADGRAARPGFPFCGAAQACCSRRRFFSLRPGGYNWQPDAAAHMSGAIRQDGGQAIQAGYR
jgi:hypothetical protein